MEFNNRRLKKCIDLGRKFYAICVHLWKYSKIMNQYDSMNMFNYSHFPGIRRSCIEFSGSRNNVPFNSIRSHSRHLEEVVGYKYDDSELEDETQALEFFIVGYEPVFYVNIYKHINHIEYLRKFGCEYPVSLLEKTYKIISTKVPVEINITSSFRAISTDGEGIKPGRHSLVMCMYKSDEFIEFVRNFIGLVPFASHFFHRNFIYDRYPDVVKEKISEFYDSWRPKEVGLLDCFSKY